MNLQVAIETRASGEANQDRAHWLKTPPATLFILADGAGGVSGGANAAQHLIDIVLDNADRLVIDELGLSLVSLVHTADILIHDEPNAGLTTCVLVALIDGELVGVSVGDSCALLIEGDKVTNLTQNQHSKPLVGSCSCAPIVFEPHPFTGTLLMASDGLSKYLAWNSIPSLLVPDELQWSASALIEAVRLPSGDLWDDTTVLLASKPRPDTEGI